MTELQDFFKLHYTSATLFINENIRKDSCFVHSLLQEKSPHTPTWLEFTSGRTLQSPKHERRVPRDCRLDGRRRVLQGSCTCLRWQNFWGAFRCATLPWGSEDAKKNSPKMAAKPVLPLTCVGSQEVKKDLRLSSSHG